MSVNRAKNFALFILTYRYCFPIFVKNRVPFTGGSKMRGIEGINGQRKYLSAVNGENTPCVISCSDQTLKFVQCFAHWTHNPFQSSMPEFSIKCPYSTNESTRLLNLFKHKIHQSALSQDLSRHVYPPVRSNSQINKNHVEIKK